MLMAKAKKKIPNQSKETDGAYFLKMVLYLIVGAQWVFLTDVAMTKQIPLPVGLLVGMAFTTHEHFKIDRKIEYAILIIACFIGYWAQTGILISSL